jgi:hypothetical protein
MSVYDDFRDAHVDHVVFGDGNTRLADARARMKADPNYDHRKYVEAVFTAERIETAYRVSIGA